MTAHMDRERGAQVALAGLALARREKAKRRGGVPFREHTGVKRIWWWGSRGQLDLKMRKGSADHKSAVVELVDIPPPYRMRVGCFGFRPVTSDLRGPEKFARIGPGCVASLD